MLLCFERGLLAPGVLHDIPYGALRRDSGWKVAYCAFYSERTIDDDLDQIPATARYVMLAAYHVNGAKSSDCRRGHTIVDLPKRELLIRASTQQDPADTTIVYALAAWARREIALHVTHDRDAFRGGKTTSDNSESGVHFYRWPRHAVGFSSDPELFLQYADSGAKRGLNETKPNDRLSWNLDRGESTGGWRAGSAWDLGDSNEWLKVLLYRE